MSRDPVRTKFMDDQLLGDVLEQIAYREATVSAAPFLLEAAGRLQGRPAPKPRFDWRDVGRQALELFG